jgi:hypothetical protein
MLLSQSIICFITLTVDSGLDLAILELDLSIKQQRELEGPWFLDFGHGRSSRERGWHM